MLVDGKKKNGSYRENSCVTFPEESGARAVIYPLDGQEESVYAYFAMFFLPFFTTMPL